MKIISKSAPDLIGNLKTKKGPRNNEVDQTNFVKIHKFSHLCGLELYPGDVGTILTFGKLRKVRAENKDGRQVGPGQFAWRAPSAALNMQDNSVKKSKEPTKFWHTD